MSDYLRRAQEALDTAKKKRPGYRGDCCECRYSYRTPLGRNCKHPAVTLVAFNLTDDDDKRYIVECGEQRDTHSMWGPVVCGPDGALFEKRVGFLSRLFNAGANA